MTGKRYLHTRTYYTRLTEGFINSIKLKNELFIQCKNADNEIKYKTYCRYSILSGKPNNPNFAIMLFWYFVTFCCTFALLWKRMKAYETDCGTYKPFGFQSHLLRTSLFLDCVIVIDSMDDAGIQSYWNEIYQSHNAHFIGNRRMFLQKTLN